MTEIQELQAKVNNLEICLLGYIALTSELLPQSNQESVDDLTTAFFNASSIRATTGLFIESNPIQGGNENG